MLCLCGARGRCSELIPRCGGAAVGIGRCAHWCGYVRGQAGTRLERQGEVWSVEGRMACPPPACTSREGASCGATLASGRRCALPST
eukprot:364372-Chlamydomonas_euryale.AAC.13